MRYLILTSYFLSVIACSVVSSEVSATREEERKKESRHRSSHHHRDRHERDRRDRVRESSHVQGPRYDPLKDDAPAAASGSTYQRRSQSQWDVRPAAAEELLQVSCTILDRSRDPRLNRPRPSPSIDTVAVEAEMMAEASAAASTSMMVDSENLTQTSAEYPTTLQETDLSSRQTPVASMDVLTDKMAGENDIASAAPPQQSDATMLMDVPVAPAPDASVSAEDGEVEEPARIVLAEGSVQRVPTAIIGMIQDYLSTEDLRPLWRTSRHFGVAFDRSLSSARDMHWHIDEGVMMHGAKAFMDVVPNIQKLHCHLEPGDFRRILLNLSALQKSGGIPHLRQLMISFPALPERLPENSQALVMPTTIPAGVDEFSFDGALAARAVSDFWEIHSQGASAHPIAQYLHGNALMTGTRYVQKNEAVGKELWKAAAAAGHVRAQYHVGHMAWAGIIEGISPAMAVGYLERVAATGYPEAQYYLGRALYNGWGVFEANPARAVRLWTPLAEHGNPGALYWLSDAYWTGRGVDAAQPDLAIGYLDSAVQKGYEPAVQRRTALNTAWNSGMGPRPSLPRISPPSSGTNSRTEHQS